jgi:hypothetical protein
LGVRDIELTVCVCPYIGTATACQLIGLRQKKIWITFFGTGGGILTTPFGSWSYDFSKEDLDLKLAATAAKRGERKSDLIRTALESIVKANETITPNSCLDLAKDIVGSVEGPSECTIHRNKSSWVPLEIR